MGWCPYRSLCRHAQLPSMFGKEEVPRRFEFLPDEPEAEHPAPEGVGFVFGLLGLGACEPDLPGQLAHGQAKLDHGFQVPRMEPVLLAVCRGVELEKPKFDGPFCEECMKICHSIATLVIMLGFCHSRNPGSRTRHPQAGSWSRVSFG